MANDSQPKLNHGHYVLTLRVVGRLLEQALAHYRGFLQTHGASPRLQRETALAAYRLAWIVNDIGSRDEAVAAYGEAVARLDQALEHTSADIELRTKTAESRMQLGMAQQQRGKSAEAAAALEDAATRCKALLDEAPADPSVN